MAWEDRPYYRDRTGGQSRNPLMWLLTGSVSLGSWFGIAVKIHASMLLIVGLTLLLPGSVGGARNALTFGMVLFGIVLLHEFGHCFASRWVGGSPTEILIWPLGGLASANPPHSPWPTFITVAGGPLVNVLICIVTSLILVLMRGSWDAVPWNPFSLSISLWLYHNTIAYYLWFIFSISWMLLLFNLWPIFPLDGGQLLQSLLWVKIGYYKATNIACTTGMIGAGVMGMMGIVGRQLLLLFIAFSGFMTCLNLRQQIKAAGPYAFENEYVTEAWRGGSSSKRKSNRGANRARKAALAAAGEQAKIDRILAKVSEHGMHSLSWLEKRTLRKATERQRKAEMARARRAG